MENYHKETHCSFCGKSESEVETIINGPNGMSICNECIETCEYILNKGKSEDNSGLSLYTPKEIKAKLDEYIMDKTAQNACCPLPCTITTSA